MSSIRTLVHQTCLALAILVSFGSAAFAEPPRAVEASGNFGAFRFAGDESWGGTAAAYGFTGTIPFARRWAFEADVVRATDEDYAPDGTGFRERRTLTLMHVVYRRGTEKVYWYVGGGPGFQFLDRRVRVALPGPPDSLIGTREFESSETDFSPLGYKTGVVVNPASRLIVRGELLLQHFYALPNTVVRVGIGWRF